MISGIGDKIRYLRDKSGMTQTYLAKRLGISRSAVNLWEMSLSTPSLANIVELTQIFHVSADYFLCDQERLCVDITSLEPEEQEIVLKLVDCLQKKGATSNH
ncbi:MAG: helix-turn-helix transcriptional regulator [Clostridia bacterium]|nr:helix-turn-helix transcriptional regulator [Clostridia bacterium]